MAILYPPYIEGKLPAQYGESLKIPFEYNRATGLEDVEGISLKCKIKPIGAHDYEEELELTGSSLDSFGEFNLEENLLEVGEFYKIQLSWDNNLFSTIGIFKYTSEPTFSGEIGFPNCVISYSNEDTTEKLYQYYYEINGYKSDKYFFTDLNISIDLRPYINFGEEHTLTVYGITLNNCVFSNEYEIIINKTKIQIDTTDNLPYEIDKEKGSINFTDEGISFIRRKKINGEKYWFILDKAEDITSEFGTPYIYQIVFENEYKEFSNIQIFFNDMFLSDKEKIYCIQFDPKISSFKTTILESKTDTLGGKYPFFFRNGQSGYKEFPISGLISRLMNYSLEEVEEHRVITQAPVQSSKLDFSTNLSDNNIYLEREFRIELLNWLNNGKPKLFKSPTEGNFIVRLMNISLSPNETLGRMLYSFNSTAYEAAELNAENLKKYNLI